MAIETTETSFLPPWFANNPYNNPLNLDYGDEFNAGPFPRFPHVTDEQAAANVARARMSWERVSDPPPSITVYVHAEEQELIPAGD